MDQQNQTRDQALREWREQGESTALLGRRFSGDRIRRAVTGDRLTKAGFVTVTGVVLFFVFTHDSKEKRLLNREARAAMQLEEPSVRDFRPPVMPARLNTAQAPETPRELPTRQADLSPAAPEDAELAARRRRAEQLHEARTKSEIVVRAAGGALPVAGAQPISGGTVAMPPYAAASIAREAPAEGATDANAKFALQVGGRAVATSVPSRTADLRCAALQGKMIDAELETAINTDLPGQIRAIVSSPLYAEQGREPLLTAGSRLIGVYNSAVQKGQVRIFAIWNRAIRPDGVQLTLDSHATDALGRSGVQGETDNHFPQIFGTSVLLSIIGAGTSTLNVNSDTRHNSADELRRQVQQSFGRSADRLLEPYGNISPTNTVRQGERIKVFLNRDLNFCPFNVATTDRRELVLP